MSLKVVMLKIKMLTAATLVLACALAVSGCATPVGVRSVTPRTAYQDTFANSLSDGVVSDNTKVVLDRFDLQQTFKKNPAAAIETLHKKALRDGRRDILYALSELCYEHGEQLHKSFFSSNRNSAPDYFLLSAVYAYLYILADMREPPPSAFDQRFRAACDLYNFSLWRALSTGNGGRLVLQEGQRKLPVGGLVIALKQTQFPWKLEDFEEFLPSYKYAVRGITVRNRTRGMGLPLIGLKKQAQDGLSAYQPIPVTAFLDIQGGLAELTDGSAAASLKLYSAYDDAEVFVDNRVVPLETDTTTPTAYHLEHESILWDFGLKAFLGKLAAVPNKLYIMQPYQPGRIPVVFVHGTMSSPVWWMEMWNTLQADPELRRNYQFWFFMYNSSALVSLSAADLRDSLRSEVALLDPEAKDPALRQMVVIGHSQGGLLTKLMAVDTGDRLLRSLTDKDIDSLHISDEQKTLLRRALIVEPLPFVKRVVFISTPHRGSFRSSLWVRTVVQKIISLPSTIVTFPLSAYTFLRDDVKILLSGKLPVTSLDSMSPGNPVMKELAEIPLASGVTGNSIIAVENPEDPREKWNDGVVEYASAHLDGMESEFIVHAGHSCQGNPLTIEEVRRILIEHAVSIGAIPKP
jgi:pimeloyl-ACP methyl ester carboxylesterase